MDLSEQEIVAGLKKQDDSAYKALYEKHYQALCCFAEILVKDPYTAETIVGDVIFHLWELGPSLDIKSSLRSYLIAAVKNRCLNHLALDSVRKVKLYPQTDFGKGDLDIFDTSVPVNGLIAKELEHEVNEAIDALPPKTRNVFLKSRVDGKTYAQIANELKISVNTVKYHISEALSLLSASLSKAIISMALLLFLTR